MKRHYIDSLAPGVPLPGFDYGGNSYAVSSVTYLPGTDLAVVTTNANLAQWAALYEGAAPIGGDFVIFGLGGPRGAEVRDAGNVLRGWYPTASDGVMRWGTQTLEDSITIGGLGELLVSSFGSGPTEAGLSPFDSGGGLFVFDAGIWKLAGITYGAETFASAANGTGRLNAAIFDPDGYYRFENGAWTEQDENDPGTRYYFSSIAASSGNIAAITGVPEPSAAALSAIGVAFAALAFRHRRES